MCISFALLALLFYGPGAQVSFSSGVTSQAADGLLFILEGICPHCPQSCLLAPCFPWQMEQGFFPARPLKAAVLAAWLRPKIPLATILCGDCWWIQHAPGTQAELRVSSACFSRFNRSKCMIKFKAAVPQTHYFQLSNILTWLWDSFFCWFVSIKILRTQQFRSNSCKKQLTINSVVL